jgi:hypothetical protein
LVAGEGLDPHSAQTFPLPCASPSVSTLPVGPGSDSGTPSPRILEFTRLALLTWALQKQFHPSVAALLPLRLSPSTVRTYEMHWRAFIQFLKDNDALTTVSKDWVLRFFLYKFRAGTCNSSLRICRAALSDPLLYCLKILVSDKEF